MSVRSLLGAAVTAVAAATILGAPTAVAQPGTTVPAECVPFVGPSSFRAIRPATTAFVRGELCAPDEEIVFTIDGIEVARTTSDETGAFEAALPLPAQFGLGTYTLVATSASVTVTMPLTLSFDLDFVTHPPVAAPGELIDVFGQGCDQANAVSVSIEGIVVAGGSADENGLFDIEARIPDGLAPGERSILVTCGEQFAAEPFTILSPAPPAPRPISPPVVRPGFLG